LEKVGNEMITFTFTFTFNCHPGKTHDHRSRNEMIILTAVIVKDQVKSVK